MNDEYKKMLERFEQICQNAKKELCGKKEKEQEKRFIEKIDSEIGKDKEVVKLKNEIDRLNQYIDFYKDLTEKQNKEIERIKELSIVDSQQSQEIIIELNQEIERLNNIINEVREYIEERYNGEVLTHTFDKCNVRELLEILYKGE